MYICQFAVYVVRTAFFVSRKPWTLCTVEGCYKPLNSLVREQCHFLITL